jgi:hypothetical protein
VDLDTKSKGNRNVLAQEREFFQLTISLLKSTGEIQMLSRLPLDKESVGLAGLSPLQQLWNLTIRSLRVLFLDLLLSSWSIVPQMTLGVILDVMEDSLTTLSPMPLFTQ